MALKLGTECALFFSGEGSDSGLQSYLLSFWSAHLALSQSILFCIFCPTESPPMDRCFYFTSAYIFQNLSLSSCQFFFRSQTQQYQGMFLALNAQLERQTGQCQVIGLRCVKEAETGLTLAAYYLNLAFLYLLWISCYLSMVQQQLPETQSGTGEALNGFPFQLISFNSSSSFSFLQRIDQLFFLFQNWKVWGTVTLTFFFEYSSSSVMFLPALMIFFFFFCQTCWSCYQSSLDQISQPCLAFFYYSRILYQMQEGRPRFDRKSTTSPNSTYDCAYLLIRFSASQSDQTGRLRQGYLLTNWPLKELYFEELATFYRKDSSFTNLYPDFQQESKIALRMERVVTGSRLMQEESNFPAMIYFCTILSLDQSLSPLQLVSVE